MKTSINIPIYRAKKIDSDEYVEGCLDFLITPIQKMKLYQIATTDPTKEYITINPSTLAIHFLDMLDSEGNKIFASLSEDGRGGDYFEAIKRNFVFKYMNGKIVAYGRNIGCDDIVDIKHSIKIIGIQQ